MLLTTNELLKHVKISRATLYRLIKEGLPFTEVSPRKKLYDPDVVLEFLQKRRDEVQDQLIIGENYTNEQITTIFRVGNMGGMRKSNTKNALVLISFHSGKDQLYNDYWKEDTLYYTGMGQNGDQDINFAQNKTLAESKTNGVTVYLFEMFQEQVYKYRGIVELTGGPFLKEELDANGNPRKVWKFPLKLITPNYLSENEINTLINTLQEETNKKLKKNWPSELISYVDSIPGDVSVLTTLKKTYIRNPIIAIYAKIRADGVCELCGENAPFRVDGKPFLESHHIIPLSEGGKDSIDNVTALCPNCHRKVHYLKNTEDIKVIRENVKKNEINLRKQLISHSTNKFYIFDTKRDCKKF